MFCSDCDKQKSPKLKSLKSIFSRLNKKWVYIGCSVLAAVLIAVIVIGVIFFAPPKNYGMYIKDGQMYYTDFEEAPFKLTENMAENMSDSDLASIGYLLSNRARMTKNNKMLFFVDGIDENGNGALCCRFVESESRELMTIDTRVQGYSITKNGEMVLYIKEGSLYKFTYDSQEREMLVENTVDVRMSADGESAVILDGNNRCLYYNVDGKLEEISAKAERLHYISEDFKTVYFNNENTAYKWVKGKGTKTVADDFYSMVAVYDSGKFYYVSAEFQEVLATDYINDDVKDSDQEMQKPAYPLPPAKKDYASTEEWKADYDIYLGQMDRYYQLMQEYYAKQDRDAIRKQLDGYKITLATYTLHYYDGKNSTKLCDNYNFEEVCRDYNPKKPALVYSVYINDAKAKFSDIGSLSEVESAILGSLHSYPKTQLAIGSAVQSLSFGVQSSDFNFTPDGKKLYFIDSVENNGKTGSIYTVKIGSSAGKPKVYDKSVDVEQGITMLSSGSIAYCKNNDDKGRKLYIDDEFVARNVSMHRLGYNKYSKTVAFYTDCDTDGVGTLKVLKRGKQKTVSENVYRYSFTPNGEILYLKNYDLNTNKGDLYLFDGKKSHLVDTAVTEIVDAYSYTGRSEWYY